MDGCKKVGEWYRKHWKALVFVIVGATTMQKIAPVMLELYDAPYGTDLCWMYKGNTHVGFYDLISNKDTTIDKILNKG